MGFIRGTLAFLGRTMICAIFVLSACTHKIPNFDATVETMTKANIPSPRIALIGAILFLLVGSFCVITGYAGRLGALLLLTFLAAATYYFHPFWNFAQDTPEFAAHLQDGLKNVAIGGGLVLLIAHGARKWGSDRDEEEHYEYP